MNKRKVDDAEVQRVVGNIHHASQEMLLIEMTANWGEADFRYAIERLDIHQPKDRREVLRPLYRNLRSAREVEEVACERHNKISHQLEDLKKPHWSVTPNFWVTVAIFVLTLIAAVVAVIGLHH
jgi:hypothetical protein